MLTLDYIEFLSRASPALRSTGTPACAVSMTRRYHPSKHSTEVRKLPRRLLYSTQIRKVLLRLLKLRIPLPNHRRRSALKRLFRGNTIKPPLLRKLLMRRKIKPNQKRNVPPVRNSLGVVLSFIVLPRRRLGFGLSRRMLLVRVLFLSLLRFPALLMLFFSLERRGLTLEIFPAIQLVLQFLVQPKRLLPHLQLMTRLLRHRLVGAKIKSHIRVRHSRSLGRPRRQVKPSQVKPSEHGSSSVFG